MSSSLPSSPPPLPPPPAPASPSSTGAKRKRSSMKLPPYDPAVHRLIAPSSAGGRDSSPCWTVFRLVDNDPEFRNFALCTLCMRWFTRKNGSTSSLNSHVRRTHPEVVIGGDEDGDGAASKKAKGGTGGASGAAAVTSSPSRPTQRSDAPSSSSSSSSSPLALPVDAVRLLLDYRFSPDNAAVWANTEPHALQAAWSTLVRAVKLSFGMDCTRRELEDICNRQLESYRRHKAKGGDRSAASLPRHFHLMDQFMSAAPAPTAAAAPQHHYSRFPQQQEERKSSSLLPLSSRLRGAEAEVKDSGSSDGGSAGVSEVREMFRAHERVLEQLAADNRHFLLQLAAAVFPDADLAALERKFGSRAAAVADEEEEESEQKGEDE